MKFEKGAIYRVQVPEDYYLDVQRNFWKDKLFKMTIHGCLGIETTLGKVINEDGSYPKGWERAEFPFWKAWLADRIYISPFDGKIK